MQITGPKGNDIATMEGWGARVKGGHFREGRSAYSLADFILNRDGAAILESRLSSVLSHPVKLQRAIPEFRASFDSYRGNTSNLWQNPYAVPGRPRCSRNYRSGKAANLRI